jgi:ArsR family transcriptional regulator
LSDKTRLRLLVLLERREVCVCDLMAALNLPQPAVSRHLSYLKGAGLVSDRKQGRWRYYSRIGTRSRAHAGLWACVDSFAAADPAARAALRRARAGSACA